MSEGGEPARDALRPRILFIGFPESSHTHSWIDLLDPACFDVRLFALPSAAPPADWPVVTYLTTAAVREASPIRRSVFPPHSAVPRAYNALETAVGAGALPAGRLPIRLLRGALKSAAHLYASREPATIEGALLKVLREWRPDIVHTLGIDPTANFYFRTQAMLEPSEAHPLWVVQARGGPDLDVYRFSPERMVHIRKVFAACDHFVADNQQNYDIAVAEGLDENKIRDPAFGVVPGTGGIDVDALRARWSDPPSKRERIVLWPKTYETLSSKAHPVLEAIKIAWPRIQPCRFEMLWTVQEEVQLWLRKSLPEEILAHCAIKPKVDRAEVLDLLVRSRVMFAPSLTDGVPNAMLEAMACGAFPVVSPLATITPAVEEERNVLFARNLYPDELAAALVRAMNDDALVDGAAERNLVRVRELADRAAIRVRAKAYYDALVASGDGRATTRAQATVAPAA